MPGDDEGGGPWFVEDDEVVQLVERPSWGYGVALFVKAVVALGLVAAGAYLALSRWLPAYSRFVAPAVALLAALAAVWAWRRCVTSLYVVTDKRLFAKRGRLLLRLQFASHDRVTDVRYDRGVIDRLVGIGHLTFSTAGDDVRLPGLADPSRAKRAATQARDAFVQDLLSNAGLDAEALRAEEPEITEAPTGEEPDGEASGDDEPPSETAAVDPASQGLAPFEGTPPGYVAGGETVRWLAKPTKAVLVNSLGFLFVVASVIASAGFADLLASADLPVTGGTSLAVVVVGAYLVFQWLRLENTELVLTDDRVYLKRGIVATNVNQITYDKITDITYDEGIIGRFLGYATLEINTSGSASKPISVSGITEPLAVKRLVEEAAER